MNRRKESKLYRVWDGMVQRCCNPNAHNYRNYGGRGIEMCDEWRNDFSAFERYCIEHGWKKGLQVDRIDNDKGYFPENVRFVTTAENARNKRTNNNITLNGETMCAADWCEKIGMSDSTLWRRLKSGWSVEEALTRPIQRHKCARMDGEG